MSESWIVAMGGGAFADEPANPLLHNYILSLSEKADPRVLFIPTATGDAAALIARFCQIFTPKPCRPSHLALILEPPRDLEGLIMAQDIIYVGGGNTAVMLAAWQLHGLDKALIKAYEAEKVFCGGSAGAIGIWGSSREPPIAPRIAELHPGGCVYLLRFREANDNSQRGRFTLCLGQRAYGGCKRGGSLPVSINPGTGSTSPLLRPSFPFLTFQPVMPHPTPRSFM